MPHLAVVIAIIGVIAFGIVIPTTWWCLRGERTDRSNDSVNTAMIRFVGGVFLLLGSFSVATLWAAQGQAAERMAKELGTLSLLSDDIVAASPESKQLANDLLLEYAISVKDDELSVLAQGLRLDPATAFFDRTSGVLDEYGELLDGIEAAGSDVDELRKDLDKLEIAYLDRLSWQPPLSAALLVPGSLIAVAALFAIAFYPSGSSSRDKWLQSLLSAGVAVCLLSMVAVLVSPQNQAAQQTRVVDDFLTKVYARPGR